MLFYISEYAYPYYSFLQKWDLDNKQTSWKQNEYRKDEIAEENCTVKKHTYRMLRDESKQEPVKFEINKGQLNWYGQSGSSWTSKESDGYQKI